MNSPENVLDIYDRNVLEDENFINNLAEYLNYLITNDFQKLIQVLYRMDVDEHKLRYMLSGNEEKDSGMLLARLLIERQMEKAALREQFKNNEGDWKEC